MKHNIKITAILLGMFLITQLIGLFVINAYTPKTILIDGKLKNITLPYGMQPPEEMKVKFVPWHIIVSMIIAIALIFLLMKIKSILFLKLWFFFVVIIALALAVNAFLLKFEYSSYIALAVALPLAIIKIFKRNLLVHNLTELLIYPGIAAVFVPILGIWAVIILLLLISVYDIYAVWHAGFMQKMAKFQINKLRIFAGFFVPYTDKKTKLLIQRLKEKYKNKKIPSKILKTKKIKINLAILGGGDVVFPIILAGVVLRSLGFIPALIISLFATLALLFLFTAAKKGKFYPAMPFLTAGCLLGLLVGWLIYIL